MGWHGSELRGENVPLGKKCVGRFGRMFPDLLPLQPGDGPTPEELGKIIQARSGELHFNPDIPAGYTYLGQFIDHDITFDPTSLLEQENDEDAGRNYRTPYLELDSIYGSGPRVDPHLYDRE